MMPPRRGSGPTTTAENLGRRHASEPSEMVVPIGSLADDIGVTVATPRHYDYVGVIEPILRVGGKSTSPDRRWAASTSSAEPNVPTFPLERRS